MSYKADVLRVLIGSPSDVQEERKIIEESLYVWNSIHSLDERIILQPIMWERDSAPQLGDRPQAILNAQIVNDCDLLIATFWTKIGSPTGKYNSGTVEEIQEFIKAKKPVMLYFSSKPADPTTINLEQLQELNEFKNAMKQEGLYKEYDLLQNFKYNLNSHISKNVKEIKRNRLGKNAEQISNNSEDNISHKSQNMLDNIAPNLERIRDSFYKEKNSEPLDLITAKDILKNYIDSLTEVKPILATFLDRKENSRLERGISKMKLLLNHRILFDGGHSYEDFWAKADDAFDLTFSALKACVLHSNQ